MLYWPAKAPGAVLVYEFDWSDGLPAGQALAAATVTATGVTVDAQSFDAPTAKVTVKISGGTLGTPGVVVCSITTNGSPAQTDQETAILPIGEEPVTLEMVKRQVRAEGTTADDDYVLELIQSAREHVEIYTATKMVPAAVTMTFDHFESMDRLPSAPLQTLTAVKYLDATGVEQTLDPATYEFVNVASDPLRPRVRLAYNKTWPPIRTAEDAVRVTAVVGYTIVPKPLIRAVLLLVHDWFDNRSQVAVDVRGVPTELPHRITALLSNFRR